MYVCMYYYYRCLSRDLAGLIVLMRRFSSFSCSSNSPRDVAASVVALIAPNTSSSEYFENSSSKLTTVAKSTPAAAEAPAPCSCVRETTELREQKYIYMRIFRMRLVIHTFDCIYPDMFSA